MKNQKRPPRGKPCSIIRVAGGIMGEKSFASPIPFLRGLFRHEMMRKFSVIVAAQADFRKYRVKQCRNDTKQVEIDETKEIHRVFM